jgi:hypothetical protein
MTLGSLLKDRRFLERKLCVRLELPVGVLLEDGRGAVEIILVVRPEIKARFPRGSCRDGREETSVHHSVLVVAALRPRVRKEDKDGYEARFLRHDSQEILSVRADEMKLGELRALPLAMRADDPVRHDVDADAFQVGMGRGIGGKEMAVAASDLPDEFSLRSKDRLDLAFKVIPAARDVGVMLR